MKKSDYYNGSNVLNAQCPISFLVGNRSTGKSFYWKRYVIKEFIEHEAQFLYVRRTIDEMEITAPRFWEDIQIDFPQYSLEAKTIDKVMSFTLTKYTKSNEVIWSKICGYACGLSSQQKIKSFPLDKVNTILYDEFLPDNMKYLKPSNPMYESTLLLSLHMSVARGYKQPIREEVKTICIANNASLLNPYFAYFNINLLTQDRTIVNNVYAEKFMNVAVANEIKKSKFGQILDATTYGDFALNNVALNDNIYNIQKAPNKSYAYFYLYAYAWYMCKLGYDGCLYFSPGYDETFPRKYKMVHVPNNDPVPWFKGDIVDTVRQLAYQDKVYYSSPKVLSALAGLFIPTTI